jgi:hypothetical protein
MTTTQRTTATHEVKQVINFRQVKELYAEGWRLVSSHTVLGGHKGEYVLEREVPRDQS